MNPAIFLKFLMVLAFVGIFSHRAFSTVTGLAAKYQHGQVFLTWQKVSDPETYYKVYRSTLPITESTQLSQCEYLGWVNSESAKDFNLTLHDGTDVFLVIDSGKAALQSIMGLFVATTLIDGNYFYAVTIINNGAENKVIVPGGNSIVNAVEERIERPQPVFQQYRLVDSQNVAIYAIFVSMKTADGELMNEAGFIANDFAVYLNNAVSKAPVRIRFHAGGSDFLTSVTLAVDSEIIISPEDYLPNGGNVSWWGANENHEIYDSIKFIIPPESGINYNYGQQRTSLIIDWAISHLPVDSNRIYLDGASFGSLGAYFYAITYPDKIAAVKLGVSNFNLSFLNDSNPFCTVNEGNNNRKGGDDLLGTVSTNLMTNLDIHTYDALNGGWVFRQFNERNYPFIYAVNGKYDTLMGWTGKTVYFDSVNATNTGGYYFWDSRNHGGIGATWGEMNFDLFRYRRNLSYPAFANCSINEDYGNGLASDGAAFGTVNGFLDWKNEITDVADSWLATIFLRDLLKEDGSVYESPEQCTVDVTLRRLQNFHPAAGETLSWNLWHNLDRIQSGSFVYGGGLVTIPQISVYKDSVRLEIIRGESTETDVPSSLDIYPNPATQDATIRFNLQDSQLCEVNIYNEQGSLISVLKNEFMNAGTYQLVWNIQNSSIGPGLYFITLQTANERITGKLAVIK